LLTGDEFGYYGKKVSVEADNWVYHTIAVGDLELPGSWAEEIPFDITTCTKLAWEVVYDENVTSDTLDIAEVSFIGTFQFISPSMWSIAETTVPTGERAGWFATFDALPYSQTPLKPATYWYAYNDAEAGGTSTISESCASRIPATNRLELKFVPQSGSFDMGQGAALEYTLGASIPKDTIRISGFAGVGVNIFDSLTSSYFNADSAGVTDVYFEYITTGSAKNITLEISDVNDVSDATHQERGNSRGAGIVYYRNFPATNGSWRMVKIPLDSLVIHDSWAGYVPVPFNKSHLAKLQWKVQGSEGTNGIFAIDNIALVGGSFGVPVVKKAACTAAPAAFSASYCHDMVNVCWKGTAVLLRGKISLVTTKGAVIASKDIRSGSSITTSLSAARIPAGMYLARLKALDSRGNAVVRQMPVGIVK
jgi:hypothetical protein